jgi:type I restriction enzyme S subunit
VSSWQEVTLESVAQINPTESLPKGTIAKKIAMDALQPFTKRPSSFDIEAYNGGMKFKNGDTIVARITPCLENGKTAYIDLLEDNEVAYGSTEYIVLRERLGVTDKQFLYYFSISPIFRDVAIASMTGSSGRQRVQTDVVKKHVFEMPSLIEQKAIASVLSSLDDKIDLLHRQNTTLEAMAETLFRQWFVEEAQDDWEEKPLSFYGDIVCGKTPSKQNHSYFNGEVPFIKIPDMHGNPFIFKTEDALTELGRSSQNNKTVPPYSICVSCIATVGLVSISTKPSQTNQQINTIIPKQSRYRYFLYLTMKASYDLLHAEASGGTATLNLNTGNFSRIGVPLPPDNLLLEFESIIDPIFNKIYHNQSQVLTLEKLRDNLLPKLMSGEVRVSLNGEYHDAI